MLLHNPETHALSRSNLSSVAASRSSGYPGSYNPSAPAVEEAIKNFFLEVYDAWVKTIMSPFYNMKMPVRSPVFRARVIGAAKKYL